MDRRIAEMQVQGEAIPFSALLAIGATDKGSCEKKKKGKKEPRRRDEGKGEGGTSRESVGEQRNKRRYVNEIK